MLVSIWQFHFSIQSCAHNDAKWWWQGRCFLLKNISCFLFDRHPPPLHQYHRRPFLCWRKPLDCPPLFSRQTFGGKCEQVATRGNRRPGLHSLGNASSWAGVRHLPRFNICLHDKCEESRHKTLSKPTAVSNHFKGSFIGTGQSLCKWFYHVRRDRLTEVGCKKFSRWWLGYLLINREYKLWWICNCAKDDDWLTWVMSLLRHLSTAWKGFWTRQVPRCRSLWKQIW